MPQFTLDDVTAHEVNLHYELAGDPQGPPVLLIAPGGMRSEIAKWAAMPINPMAAFSRYRLIGMDQRNAGASKGPVDAESGWDRYTADQLALLDHLEVDSCAVIGMCIGGSYIMNLIKTAPSRVKAAVMLQPIGLDDNRDAFEGMFEAWRADIAADHPEADDASWSSFRKTMFGGDFMFCASEDDVAACETPLLLCKGDDKFHPAKTSLRIQALAKRLTFIESWKEGAATASAVTAIDAFLWEHRGVPT